MESVALPDRSAEGHELSDPDRLSHAAGRVPNSRIELLYLVERHTPILEKLDHPPIVMFSFGTSRKIDTSEVHGIV